MARKLIKNKIQLKKLPVKKILIGAGIVILLVLAYFSRSLFIAAVVNGQLISRFSVTSELEKQGGKQALDSIIVKTLILQEAKKRNVSASQKEVDTQLSTIEKNVTSQGATLDQALKQQGMTKGDLIDQIKLQLVLQKIVGDNISVTDKEIEDYMTTNKDQLPQNQTPEELKAQVSQQLKRQKEQQKIQDYLTQLKNQARIIYFVQY